VDSISASQATLPISRPIDSGLYDSLGTDLGRVAHGLDEAGTLVKMEEIGPGGHKRQRLETTFPPTSQVHRQAHAQHHTAPPTPVPLHNNYPGAPLGPPPPYGPPPSKHFGSEQRPEQQQQQFGQPVYSPNTIRDPTRPFSEGGPNPAFVRRDSAPTTIGGSVRSPDDVQHPGVPRPINTELGHDYSPYQPQPEGYESAPYMGQEGQMNGAYNGIPMSQHEPPHGMIAHGQQIPPGAVMSPYGDPNMPRPGYPPQMYGSIVYGGPPQMQQQLHAQGKRVTRAQQVCLAAMRGQPSAYNFPHRLARPAERARQSATRVSQLAATAKTIRWSANTRIFRQPSEPRLHNGVDQGLT